MRSFNRPLVVVAAALLVLAVGCGSSSNNAGDSSSTQTTDVHLPLNGYTVPPSNDTSTTEGDVAPNVTPDDQPVTRAPDPVAFCTAFGDAQTLGDTFLALDFSDGLGRLAAPGQARAVARRLKTTAVDEVVDSADAYATTIDEAGQLIGAAKNIRLLNAAVAVYSRALDDAAAKPALDWIIKNCTAEDPGLDFGPAPTTTADPTPSFVPDPNG